jgi:hypothetical protein
VLPAPLQREWLWSALNALVDACGEEPILTAPIVRASDEFFPDRWSADEAGLEALALRLLGYANLGHLDVSIELFTGETEVREVGIDGHAAATSHSGAAAWFAGIRGGVAQFGAESSKLDDPLGLVAAMAHETAHAFRRAHRLEHRDRDLEERLTDVTTIYLGFGVLTTSAAARFITRSHNTIGSSWSHSRQGYLPPEDMAFLLASQLVLRGYDANAIHAYALQLPANQAAVVRTAARELDRAWVADVLGFDEVPPAQAPPPMPAPWWRRLFRR